MVQLICVVLTSTAISYLLLPQHLRLRYVDTNAIHSSYVKFGPLQVHMLGTHIAPCLALREPSLRHSVDVTLVVSLVGQRGDNLTNLCALFSGWILLGLIYHIKQLGVHITSVSI